MADKLALVLGATGGVGSETAFALARHGWKVRALAREPESARRRVRADWEWARGDAMDAASVRAAAEGASVIVHGVNPPGYRNWGKLVLPMIDATIEAARSSGARILMPGTIYNYGPDALPVIAEEAPQNPQTKKGGIRVELEARLEEAAGEGVRTIILRPGDFFGPNVRNSWFSQAMVRPGKPVTRVVYPGKRGVGHAWAYLPDVGETFARLAARERELGPFERFHFAGHYDADGTEMVSAIGRAIGRPRLRAWPLPWTALGLLGGFDPTFRELGEMKPFWRNTARFDNARLVSLMGAEPHTPLDEAVKTSLSGLGCLPRG